MLLNRAVRSGQRFNLAIENIERFKYVQDSSKYTTATTTTKEINNGEKWYQLY